MNQKLHIFIIILLIIGFSLLLISTAAAEPSAPPCLTTDLCFEDAVKATNFIGANDIEVGYLNNGSNLDFVTTGWSTDQVRIKAGSGNGGFWGTWTWNMGDGTYEVDSADFNGDGHTDIITTNSEQDRVFIRWGHTGWSNNSVWTVGNHPHYVATGDLNGDGLDDFATGNTTGSETITVRLRNASGGFFLGTHYPAGDFLGDVAFHDCDKDGDLDLFYTAVFTDPFDQEAFVYVRENNGSGSFGSATAIDMASAGYGINLGSLVFGDLNEDGWDDMVATRNDHKLIRVLGGSGCGFNSPIVADVQSNPYSVEMADMNNDGDLDLVVSHALNQLITIYLGQGNGNMTGPYEPELTLDWHVRDIGVGDFNDDGLMDIVYAEENGVWLLLGRDGAGFGWTPPWVYHNSVWYAAVGDSSVELKDDAIVVEEMGKGGKDGVDLIVEDSTYWSTKVDLSGHVGAELLVNMVSNEETVWGLQATSMEKGLQIELEPVLITSYQIGYLLDDEMQLQLKVSDSSDTPAAVVDWDEIWCLMDLPHGLPSEICRIAIEHGIDPEDLYSWEVEFPLPLTMKTANGERVRADRIVITEIKTAAPTSAEGTDAENGSTTSTPQDGIGRIELRATSLESLVLSETTLAEVEETVYELFLPMVVR